MGQRSNDEPAGRSVEGQGPGGRDDDRSLIAQQWIGLVSADGHWRWDGRRWEPNPPEPANSDDGTAAQPGQAGQDGTPGATEDDAGTAPGAGEVTASDLDDWLREPWTTRTSGRDSKPPAAETPTTDLPARVEAPDPGAEPAAAEGAPAWSAEPATSETSPAEPTWTEWRSERAEPAAESERPAADEPAAAGSAPPEPDPDEYPNRAIEAEPRASGGPAPPGAAPPEPAGVDWPGATPHGPTGESEPPAPDGPAAEMAPGAPERVEWPEDSAAEPAAESEFPAVDDMPSSEVPPEPFQVEWSDPAGGGALRSPADEPGPPAFEVTPDQPKAPAASGESGQPGSTDLPEIEAADPAEIEAGTPGDDAALLKPADGPHPAGPPPAPQGVPEPPGPFSADGEPLWPADPLPRPDDQPSSVHREGRALLRTDDPGPPPPVTPPPAEDRPPASEPRRFGPSRPPEPTPAPAASASGPPARPAASLRTYTDGDVPMSASAITTDRLLRPEDSVQEARGFRAMLQRLLNSRARSRVEEEEERHRQLMALCRTRVPGCRRIAVISRKGGIGKTTTALMLGHQFANLRDDRVLALDANPDAGSLGDRVPSETRGTVTDILHDADRLHDYGDIRALTARAQSGLEVVASDNDPRITEALGEEDYRRVLNVLAGHYSVLVCDTGTGILDSATRGLLNQADQIVLCATQSVDASRVSALTLDWMDQNGYGHLVRDAVVSINAVHTGLADIDRLQAYFERRCRAVVRVPWDMRLALGAETTLEELQPTTQAAYLNLAAMVAAGFAR